MSLIIVYIHIVWVTKKRIPYLHSKELRKQTWYHILNYAKLKEIQIDHINGYTDHCHCLIQLKSNQNLRSIVQLLKGESSHWINEKKELDEIFQWQAGFYAASVSPSNLSYVRKYIRNQEQHHQTNQICDELDQLFPKSAASAPDLGIRSNNTNERMN